MVLHNQTNSGQNSWSLLRDESLPLVCNQLGFSGKFVEDLRRRSAPWSARTAPRNCVYCLRFIGDLILLGHPLGIQSSSPHQALSQVSPAFVEEDLEYSEGF